MGLAQAVVVDPGPKYWGEVHDPGRQGSRAKRDTNPARGSAHLVGTSPRHGLGLVCPVPSRCLVAQQYAQLEKVFVTVPFGERNESAAERADRAVGQRTPRGMPPGVLLFPVA
jgi:hypothetical protein